MLLDGKLRPDPRSGSSRQFGFSGLPSLFWAWEFSHSPGVRSLPKIESGLNHGEGNEVSFRCDSPLCHWQHGSHSAPRRKAARGRETVPEYRQLRTNGQAAQADDRVRLWCQPLRYRAAFRPGNYRHICAPHNRGPYIICGMCR